LRINSAILCHTAPSSDVDCRAITNAFVVARASRARALQCWQCLPTISSVRSTLFRTIIAENRDKRKYLGGDLDQQPRHHCIGDRDFVNIAPLQFDEKVLWLAFSLAPFFQWAGARAALLHDCLPARVRLEVAEGRLPPHPGQPPVPLPARAPEPLEGLILVPAIRMDLGDLVSCR